MDKINQGQIIFIEKWGKIESLEVTKVGKKYFYCGFMKFDLNTLTKIECPHKKAYLTEAEYLDDIERNRIIKFIYAEMNIALIKQMRIDDLKALEKIVLSYE